MALAAPLLDPRARRQSWPTDLGGWLCSAPVLVTSCPVSLAALGPRSPHTNVLGTQGSTVRGAQGQGSPRRTLPPGAPSPSGSPSLPGNPLHPPAASFSRDRTTPPGAGGQQGALGRSASLSAGRLCGRVQNHAGWGPKRVPGRPGSLKSPAPGPTREEGGAVRSFRRWTPGAGTARASRGSVNAGFAPQLTSAARPAPRRLSVGPAASDLLQQKAQQGPASSALLTVCASCRPQSLGFLISAGSGGVRQAETRRGRACLDAWGGGC